MLKQRKITKILAVPALLLSLAACAAIEGQETTGQYVDDSTITTKVKEAFVGDPQVKTMEISVETMQGVVQLSGFVNSYRMEHKAIYLAQHVNGVKSVKDNMVVRTPVPAN